MKKNGLYFSFMMGLMLIASPGCATCRLSSETPGDASTSQKILEHPFVNWIARELITNLTGMPFW